MSKLLTLRVLVNERLTAAAEEIFALFERTIVDYEEELCRSAKDNQRKQRLLLDEVNPRVLVPRAGSGVQTPLPSPAGPTVNHKVTETAQIKEEPEEQSVKQEEEQLPGFVPESIAVCVKTEESSLHRQIQTEHRGETQEDINSETEGDTEHSSDTNNDEDWKHPIIPADTQMETEADGDHGNQAQTRDRSRAAQNSVQFPGYKYEPETSAAVNSWDASGADEGSEGMKHQCSVCKKTFPSNYSLQIHRRVHTGERPYGCSMCDKTFNQKGHLKRHLITHTGEKPYSCSLCNKKFTLRSSRDTHMRTHTGETPYTCSLCGKKFAYSSILRTHMRTHTGEKPYSCSFCEKTFTQSCTLRKHLRTHTGERPYSCLLCDKTFTQSSSLRKHMRTHTNISQSNTEGD